MINNLEFINDSLHYYNLLSYYKSEIIEASFQLTTDITANKYTRTLMADYSIILS